MNPNKTLKTKMREKLIMPLLLIVYLVLSYWAVGKTIFANTVLVSDSMVGIFAEKLITGTLLGWCLIPIAIIKKILGR